MTTTAFTFASVPRAARAAFQWRLLVLWMLWMLIPTTILAMPMWNMLGANLDYSLYAAEIAQRMDMTVFTDLMGQQSKNAMAFNTSGVLAVLATLLVSPLLSAMAAAAARSPEVLGFGALTAAGLADYPRMFRMMLWSIVPLGLAAMIGSMGLGMAEAHSARTTLESSANTAAMAATVVMAVLLVLAHATVDAGRAALAIERRRTSVIKAWWHGCGMLLRRPLATLGAYGLITAAGLAVGAALVIARIQVSGAGASVLGFFAILLLVQATVAVVGWMRSARLFALMDVARALRA